MGHARVRDTQSSLPVQCPGSRGGHRVGRPPAGRHSLEHPAVLRVPHLDAVLPLVPGELVLVHDSGARRKRERPRHPEGL